MPGTDELAHAAEIIRRGGLVAFPTETVYGLGANALDHQALRRIYKAKGRPESSPLIVHVADIDMAKSLTTEWPGLADTLADCFWPGPLTIVLHKAQCVPDLATAGLSSVGVRVPAHPVALELIRLANVPIAAPSANRFTQLSPTTADHVRSGLGNSVDLILDGGPTDVGIESTVASLTSEQPIVLRPGIISVEDLRAATGVSWATLDPAQVSSESPGLHPKHYAPRTPLFLLRNGDPIPAGRGRVIKMPRELRAYTQSLYASMHRADAEGWDWIAIEEPPDTPEWAAIRDRLTRASQTTG